jgi:cytochrome P450
MLVARGASRMTEQAVYTASLSSSPVSRWLGFFPEFRQERLSLLLRCHSYGDVVKLPMGRMAELLFRQPDLAMYLLNNPVNVKHVLITTQHNYTKNQVPSVETRIFGKGVLHKEGETHHHQRRLFLPFFHGDHVASYTGLITEKATALAASWHNGATIDIEHEMTTLTLSIIWRLFFWQDVNSDARQVAEAVTVGQHLITKQYNSLLAWITPLWLQTTPHRKFSRAQQFMDGRIKEMVRNRRAARHEVQDVLGLLLAATDEAGQPLSDKEIRDELVTFLSADHETTANSLTWTWVLLSQSRTACARLAHELETVLGNRLQTAADMLRLVYTKMVWDEALRPYSPAWLLHSRVGHAEDRLPSGALLPSDTMVFISPWIMHRNARWFPDPNRFDPDRFSPEAKQARPAFSYFPVGGGGRRCVGESFAELEGLLIVATLASKVRFRLVDGQPILPDPLFTLRPNIPVHMTIQSIGSPNAILQLPNRVEMNTRPRRRAASTRRD